MIKIKSQDSVVFKLEIRKFKIVLMDRPFRETNAAKIMNRWYLRHKKNKIGSLIARIYVGICHWEENREAKRFYVKNKNLLKNLNITDSKPLGEHGLGLPGHVIQQQINEQNTPKASKINWFF